MIASLLAGGEWVDDVNALRAGGLGAEAAGRRHASSSDSSSQLPLDEAEGGVSGKSAALSASPRRAAPGRAPKPVWVAEHSTAAFLGFADRGPFDMPVRLVDWRAFTAVFGDFQPGCYLAHAVYGFFENGGRSCYVVRVSDRASLASMVDAHIGDSAGRTGLAALEAVDDISLVCAPDLMAAYQRGVIDLDGVKAVQLSMISHCHVMGERFAILDSPPGCTAPQAREWRMDMALYETHVAALYYPWLRVFDPTIGQLESIPPCGHIAGVYARSDLTTGPHRTPANQEVRGAVDLESHLLAGELDQLNPFGINTIVASAGRGMRVWGSRTLSSDPARRYIRTSRLLTFITRNIRNGTEWAIFQPRDDRRVWARIVRDIEELMSLLWWSGALVGAAQEQAFSVRWDDETNMARDDVIRAEVMFAPEAGSSVHIRVVYFCD